MNSEPMREASTPQSKPARRRRREGHAQPQRRFQHRRINAFRGADDEVFLLLNVPAQQQRDGGRNKGQRQRERREQRHDHGERHRAEHLALDARQREQRQIDEDDHEHADQTWREHFACGGEDGMQALVQRQQTLLTMLAFGKAQDAVLNDDDCAIDDQAEVERTQTHQVGTDLRLHHAGHQHQHGQRNDHRGQ